MKNQIKIKHLLRAPALLALAILNSTLATAFAQGSLTPPPSAFNVGAPQPTMPTLAQIEPRTPISGVCVITQPGSYYLTTNITVANGNAIDITADFVTLDLNGFSIISIDPNNTGNAIYLDKSVGNTDITIINGHIVGGVVDNNGIFSGSGFLNGIEYNANGTPNNIRVSGVSVSGCMGDAIDLGNKNQNRFLSEVDQPELFIGRVETGLGYSSIAESCTVNTVGGTGIIATSVSHCNAIDCGNDGIYAMNASDCIGFGAGDTGITATATANNCFGVSPTRSAGNGIFAGTANNCYGYCSFDGTALQAITANNCSAYIAASGTGISGSIVNGCVITVRPRDTPQVGINANIAIGCFSGGVIYAYIANSCFSSTGDGGVQNTYNMP